MAKKQASAETDVLIVGAGPAGAASAALLSSCGINNVVINKFSWTARTPRAHITNQRTMEVLRDLGLEQAATELATPVELMGENTYCTSLAGEELGRINTWIPQGQYPLEAQVLNDSSGSVPFRSSGVESEVARHRILWVLTPFTQKLPSGFRIRGALATLARIAEPRTTARPAGWGLAWYQRWRT